MDCHIQSSIPLSLFILTVDSESNMQQSNEYAGTGPQVSNISHKCKDVQEVFTETKINLKVMHKLT